MPEIQVSKEVYDYFFWINLYFVIRNSASAHGKYQINKPTGMVDARIATALEIAHVNSRYGKKLFIFDDYNGDLR